MDVQWMRSIVDEYVSLASTISDAEEEGSPELVAKAYAALHRLTYPVNAIIGKLNQPPINAELLHHDRKDRGYQWARNGQHAQGVLKHLDQVIAMNRTDSPALEASTLHPWVWDAAAPFWAAGQHAVAVEQGAKSLTAFLQQKSNCAEADRELVGSLFSPKPKSGTTRLWFTGDQASDTWKSRQGGLHNLAIGVYSGIRNVVTHSADTGWSEQEALEYLTALSIVARWTDETEVAICP